MSCASIAVIDAQTGDVQAGPFSTLEWGGFPYRVYEGKYGLTKKEFETLSFNVNSTLLIVRGCPEGKNCASYFYKWTGSHFELIKKVPAVPVSDSELHRK